MSYKKIIVAVDGSKISDLAFKEAVKLAKTLKAKLRVLHMVEHFPAHVAYAINVNKYQAMASKNAKELLNKYKNAALKNKVIAEGQLIEAKDFRTSAAKMILQAAKKWRANLLVMGTHGRTGFSHFMLGSVAEEILKSANVPVLVVSGPKK